MGVKTFLFLVIWFSLSLLSKAQLRESEIIERFEGYYSHIPRAYLIFNQAKYVPGDTAWFKVYLLNQDLSPMTGKNLLDIDLVNDLGQSVLQTTISVSNGVDHNQIRFPDEIAPGFYLIAATFNSELVMQKELIISADHTIVPALKSDLADVAVEGGNLVSNIFNKIHVKTTHGKSTLWLTDMKGTKLDRLVTDAYGFGSFMLKPESGYTYFIESESEQVPLPTVRDEGYSLTVKPDLNNINILLASQKSSAHPQDELMVVLSTKGKIVYLNRIFHAETTKISIPAATVPGGILQLSVLDSKGHLVAYRDVWNPDENQIAVNIHSNKQIFAPGENVALEVTLSDKNGNPLAGEFSLSVVNHSLFKEIHREWEANMLPCGRPVDSISLARVNAEQVFLSRPINWKAVLDSTTQIAKATGTRHSGRIRKRGRAFFDDSRQPLPDSTIILFYLQKAKMRYQALVREEGRFNLEMLDFFGQDELLYAAENQGELIKHIQIEWEDPVVPLPSAPGSGQRSDPDLYTEFIQNQRLINASYRFFSRSTELNTPGMSTNRSGLPEPDWSVNVQKYIRFPTVKKMIRVIVDPLFVGKKNNTNYVQVKQPHDIPAGKEPLYIIDGVATMNTEFFLNLNPDDILTIGIVRDRRELVHYGILGRYGIVLVETKQGNTREPLSDPSRLITGLNKPVSFKPPDPAERGNPHKPDFRSTIYWNPSLQTDESGKATLNFYCSDDIGKLRIVITGIAVSGHPFFATGLIEVR